MAGTAGFRTEHHPMSEVLVPADALWGAQTQFLQLLGQPSRTPGAVGHPPCRTIGRSDAGTCWVAVILPPTSGFITGVRFRLRQCE